MNYTEKPGKQSDWGHTTGTHRKYAKFRPEMKGKRQANKNS